MRLMKVAIIAEWRSARLLLALAAVSICIGTPAAVVLHRPYEVTVVRDGKPVPRAGPCWKEQRYAAKRAALEAILKRL